MTMFYIILLFVMGLLFLVVELVLLHGVSIGAILALAREGPGLMAPGERVIASGIIDGRKDEVLAGLKAAGLEPVEVKEKRGWVCIICEKKEA